MPTYYSRLPPRHYTLTPPEIQLGYPGEGCGVMGYPQPAIRRQDGSGYDQAERYGHHRPHSHPPAPTMMYQQPNYPAHQPHVQPPMTTYYKPPMGPVLPPMRTYEPPRYSSLDVSKPHHDARAQTDRQPPVKEEKPVGGVSAQLDYDMDIMTDFVAEMAVGIVCPNKPAASSFRKWVHQVLCATRLPSATILLSFRYLTIRMTMLSASTMRSPETGLHRMLTTALILGSKFLDDNTFINRSWAEVSGIEVATLNHLERKWLEDIYFGLHIDPKEPNGFDTWKVLWDKYQRDKKAAKEASRKPSPINTNVQHLRPAHPAYMTPPQSAFSHTASPEYGAKPSQSGYPTPSYDSYDPYMIRSSDTSPASAPHTGPATPEFYGGPSIWGRPEGSFSRLHSSTFHRPQPAQPQGRPLPPSVSTMTYVPQANSLWSPGGHGLSCPCMNCTRQHLFMATSFAPPVVSC